MILDKKEIITFPNTQCTNSLAPFGDANNDGKLDYVSVVETLGGVKILLYQLEGLLFTALEKYHAVGKYTNKGNNIYKISSISPSFKKLYKGKGCFY